MTLKIAQDYTYGGLNFWDWQAWIAGPADELARVKTVKWMLHPSFTPSVVESSDRESGFLLKRRGWGTFLLRADLHGLDGNVSSIRRMLELTYPDEESAAPGRSAPAKGPDSPTAEKAPPSKTPVPSKTAAPSVFLSYGAEDRQRAGLLRQTLQSLGVRVFDDSQVGAGESWELAIRNMQAAADSTIAYISSDTPSQFVAREVNASIQAGKPTLVITVEDIKSIIGVDSAVSVARIEIDDRKGIAAALNDLASPYLGSA